MTGMKEKVTKATTDVVKTGVLIALLLTALVVGYLGIKAILRSEDTTDKCENRTQGEWNSVGVAVTNPGAPGKKSLVNKDELGQIKTFTGWTGTATVTCPTKPDGTSDSLSREFTVSGVVAPSITTPVASVAQKKHVRVRTVRL